MQCDSASEPCERACHWWSVQCEKARKATHERERAMCHVQCAMYNAQCAMQSSMCNVQCAMWFNKPNWMSVQCANCARMSKPMYKVQIIEMWRIAHKLRRSQKKEKQNKNNSQTQRWKKPCMNAPVSINSQSSRDAPLRAKIFAIKVAPIFCLSHRRQVGQRQLVVRTGRSKLLLFS